MRTEEAALHLQLGLTDEEYSRIQEVLGREPNRAELAMYAVMWSEHCSYKSSRIHLRTLPSKGPAVLMGPGEGAGVIEVDGVAVAFRLESHNHPSFVEPFQGAATGIGGIVRDVLSVGARPVALLDPLRFGPLPVEGRIDQATANRNRVLTDGVVSGISSYGNCIGVPTVGGEIKFEDCYSGNPLVNVMCVGVAPAGRLRRATATGVGNAVLLLGSKTGRDGIGGVSVLASAAFDETAAEKRPSVQVGDPFTEKLLIEATLELLDRELVVGLQDLGGAGLSCAASETAAKAGNGMRIELDKVSRREPGMEPFEVLTSESQERMLVVVRPESVSEALSICARWGLEAALVGEVTASGQLEVFENGEKVAAVPAASLGDGPLYDRPRVRPVYLDEVIGLEVAIAPVSVGEVILQLVSSPNIASKRWAFEQYDHQVMLGTVVRPGHDAAVLRIPGTSTRIAISTDGNGRYCFIDPYEGARHTVAEAYRNLAAVGAEALALTNCLNLGNPEDASIMWQFAEVVRGLGDSARELGTPVTGGNVSFYNQTGETSIYPTPIVGMIGSIPADVKSPPLGFVEEGATVAIVGATAGDLGGSEYARTHLRVIGGRLPELDIGVEVSNAAFVRDCISAGLFLSVHDLSEGGIVVALAEACAASGMGVRVLPISGEGLPVYQWLFSETPSRYLVSFRRSDLKEIQTRAAERGAPVSPIGEVVGRALVVEGEASVTVDALTAAYHDSFAASMEALTP